MVRVSIKIFLGLLCLVLAQTGNTSVNEANTESVKTEDRKMQAHINETANRLVVCLLLYHYQWKNISKMDFVLENDTELTSDFSYKVKAQILKKCHQELPQDLANEIAAADTLDAVNETLVKYADIDLEPFKTENPDLNVTEEEGKYLNVSLTYELELFKEETKRRYCADLVEEKAVNDTKIIESFITPTRNHTEVETRFLELFMEECMLVDNGDYEGLLLRLDEFYTKAKESDFDWAVKNWGLFEDEGKEESSEKEDQEEDSDENDDNDNKDEIGEVDLDEIIESEQQNVKQDL
eukprot:TRINITY_DN1445_c0_g1_i14.p2 TRINITY_DN1445_c0_g1~~TRINITY_DN1445_c0_g1_i14.p2  ORF type:complete len:295 (-),score=108.05 TRINITY_DN1445_c0_g1_i14:174-1058(-)